jgi:hypothetical protein
MTVPLHTGSHTVTVCSEWSVWDTRLRLVLTDPWAMHHAREVLEEQLRAVDRVLRPRRSRRTGQPVSGAELAAVFGCGSAPVRPTPFPYGLAAASSDAEVHQPAPQSWQLELDGRAGLHLEPGPSVRAWTAQRCAEQVAEASSCGVLVALGSDVATSGLAPVGGWRVELADRPRAAPTVIALDGGALSRVSAVRPGPRGRSRLLRAVVPSTGRTVVPVWRSVAVAAADGAAASAACTGAVLRGAAAPARLSGLDLPARLVDHDGAVHTVGHWPREAARIGA